nr:GNAT family N-acetyltransferase [Rhizobium sp. Q54]
MGQSSDRAGNRAGVRDLEREDLPSVGGLFQRTFRKGGEPPASLIDYLREVFFEHPWQDDELRSKVFVGENGDVQGFVGVFPSRLELDGRPLRAAFAGSMMVEHPDRNPLAGARLLRAFLAGPQDISLTETANAVALGMWQKLALPLDTAYSLNWLRVFRPTAAAVGVVERKFPTARILRPVAAAADALGERAGFSSLRMPAAVAGRRTAFRDATQAEFAEALLSLKDSFTLRPMWDRTALDWFTQHARQKRATGKPFWRLALSPKGEVVGCYVYFASRGGIGWLLQALCTPAIAGDLVDDLFAHADGQGCAGLRGGGHPWLTPELISRKAIFYGRAFLVAHSKDASLLQPIRSGTALISGLAGENWTRLIGDSFD